MNTRYYDPEIRRFINKDAISLLPELAQVVGQLNLYWLIGAVVVIGLVALTCLTAGGFAAGMAAIAMATGGLAVPSATVTVLAFASIAAGTAFGGYALATGINAIGSYAQTGSFSSAWDYAMGAGEEAMWATVFAGGFGALGGYLSYREQYPKITHSWLTEKRGFWGGNAPIGSDGKPIELHHPYGRTGRGFYIYYPIERTAHQQLTAHEAKVYGKGIHPHAPYTNFWELIIKLFGGI